MFNVTRTIATIEKNLTVRIRPIKVCDGSLGDDCRFVIVGRYAVMCIEQRGGDQKTNGDGDE
jgi:hypothetical protein